MTHASAKTARRLPVRSRLDCAIRLCYQPRPEVLETMSRKALTNLPVVAMFDRLIEQGYVRARRG
jgi:hypothetical protein